MPFRQAYKITGSIVSKCIDKNITLDELDIKNYKLFSDLFDNDIYKSIDLKECINNRKSYGGPNPKLVNEHILNIKKLIKID